MLFIYLFPSLLLRLFIFQIFLNFEKRLLALVAFFFEIGFLAK